MVIHKGRVYRRVKFDDCSTCAFARMPCMKMPCGSGPDYQYRELFISRLAYAIVDVLFARREYDL